MAAAASTSPRACAPSVLGLAMLATGCAQAAGDVVHIETEAARPPAVAPVAPLVYAPDRSLSPIDDELARRLRGVLAGGDGRPWVLAKVGDSITVGSGYLTCLADERRVALAGRAALRATIEWFGTSVDGQPTWARRSLAAKKGWAAFAPLRGAPSPLDRELAAIAPGFATVMFGTNDIGFGDLGRYGDNLLEITDLLLARGVVPILSSIPPRGDDRAADAWVPRYNAVARAVAQARQVPFVDLHRELAAIHGHGLARDRIHLDTQGSGCAFTAVGLAHGNNRRNLLVLEMLDRLRRAVVLGERAPDPAAHRLVGDGTAARPFEIPALPFGGGGDTRRAPGRGHERYDCGRRHVAATGPAVVYALEVAAPTTLVADLVDRRHGHALVVVRDPADPASCVAAGRASVTARLTPGRYAVVVDARGDGGEYVLAVTTR